MDRHPQRKGIDALTLKLIAMVLMLLDHAWATVSAPFWFTMAGRLAFPIFAFQIAEGFFHTRDPKRYIRRMLVFALLSEIPFNLMVSDSLVFLFHQNVMFTFLIALLLMQWMERSKTSTAKFLTVSAVCGALAFVLGLVSFVDYNYCGVLTVLLFYWTYGKPYGKLLQLLGLLVINDSLGGMMLPVELFGGTFEFPQQMLAVLALVPIWLYDGRQGYHSKPVQYACYAFYPAHMLGLYLLSLFN